MKKCLLITFCLLPFLTYSQSFNEMMEIVDIKTFKKVMIENDYQLDRMEGDILLYGYNLVKDEVEGSKSEKWGFHNGDNVWKIQYVDRGALIDRYGDYPYIVDRIKNRCDFVDIIDVGGVDYVVYKCDESKFDGNIGFVISNNNGYIRYFPKE